MAKRTLQLASLSHEALTPQEPPTLSIIDYDALYRRMVDNGGWTVIRTDPNYDRQTTSGSTEAPVVKALNCHVRVVRKQPLYIRRLARDAWYVEVGQPKEHTCD